MLNTIKLPIVKHRKINEITHIIESEEGSYVNGAVIKYTRSAIGKNDKVTEAFLIRLLSSILLISTNQPTVRKRIQFLNF